MLPPCWPRGAFHRSRRWRLIEVKNPLLFLLLPETQTHTLPSLYWLYWLPDSFVCFGMHWAEFEIQQRTTLQNLHFPLAQLTLSHLFRFLFSKHRGDPVYVQGRGDFERRDASHGLRLDPPGLPLSEAFISFIFTRISVPRRVGFRAAQVSGSSQNENVNPRCGSQRLYLRQIGGARQGMSGMRGARGLFE